MVRIYWKPPPQTVNFNEPGCCQIEMFAAWGLPRLLAYLLACLLTCLEPPAFSDKIYAEVCCFSNITWASNTGEGDQALIKFLGVLLEKKYLDT